MIQIIRRTSVAHIGRGALIFAISLLILVSSGCDIASINMRSVETHVTAEGDKVMSQSIEVELDIFSGNPNPTWKLSEQESVFFLERLGMLPKTSAKELSNNLGYRGFIIRVMNEARRCLVRIQNGTVWLSQEDTNIYYSDQNRDLEQWLLNSGKSYIKSDIFRMVESEFNRDKKGV